MNKPEHYFFPAACIALLALAFIGLFAGCSSPAPESSDESAADKALQEQMSLFLNTAKPQVPLKEFECIKGDFLSHFAAHMNGTDVAIDDRADTLLMDQLSHALPAAPQAGDKYARGITFHYGLDTTEVPARLTLGLEFVKLVLGTKEIDVVPYSPAKFHAVKGPGLVPMPKAAWLKDHQAPYLVAMRVKRNKVGDPFMALDSMDHRSFTFRWEGSLEEMLNDNTGVHALVVWHVSEAQRRWSDREEDFRHNLAIHAVDGDHKALLDDDTTHTNYTMRGADLGSACPPNCVKAVFLARGLDTLSQCMQQP